MPDLSKSFYLCFLRSKIYRVRFPQTKKCAYRFVTVGALRLDINLAGQVLPLTRAKVLTVGFTVLLSFLETDGKFEVQLMPPQF